MTVIRARYYPASVVLPGEPRPRRKVYVLLAQGGEHDGLHVFGRPTEDADVHLPVDWSRTTIPPHRQARNGVSVHLRDGGLAVVTAGGGCRCGQMGRWAGPAWATAVVVTA